MSDPIKFRYFNMVNGGNGVTLYPCMWTTDNQVAWDGRRNSGTYWMVMEGQSKTCDLKNDLDGGGIAIGNNKAGQKFRLGCDVVLGDDKWVSPELFEYDPDSTVEVTIRKQGGLKDGNAYYDGHKP